MHNGGNNRFWYDILRTKLRIAHLHWGACECGGQVVTVRQDVDFGPVVIKRVPVGECEACGENYYDLFLGGELECVSIMALWRILDWRRFVLKGK